MREELLQKAKDYSKAILLRDSSGRDFYHTERVLKIAKLIQAREGGDLFLIELGSVIRSLMEHNCPINEGKKTRLAFEGLLDVLQIEGILRERIIFVVEDSNYKAELRKPKSIEGKILQDANWLDSLGAIGIARAFATGGKVEMQVYNPKIKTKVGIMNKRFQQKNNTGFNYLIEKSFRITELLNTETAFKMAKKRISFIKNFADIFLKEWQRKDFAVEHKGIVMESKDFVAQTITHTTELLNLYLKPAEA